MAEFFKNIEKIQYEGPHSKNPFSFHYYDANRSVLGKSMQEWLRPSVCYWHTFCWQGDDTFGRSTFKRPWYKNQGPLLQATDRLHAAFEFFEKLGTPFFTFHDRDIAPEGDDLKETNHNLNKIVDEMGEQMQRTGVKLLWGTANLFSHPRYMSGAATNPDPDVFAYAVAQVKAALDATHKLNGENYVFWGGREGYSTLLNTDLKQEANQLARFLSIIVEYKHKINFKGTFLIEPKPCEPTKHQYDFDSAHVYAFLQKHGLEKEFKVNIEANHATLAGHSFAHEVYYACSHDIFGSIDANRGDPQLGWDTDQFPINLRDMAMAIYFLIQHGGFTTGGFNFDTKIRRESTELKDLFYGHISGLDTLARALLIAQKMTEHETLSQFTPNRYKKWKDKFGLQLLDGELDAEKISQYVIDNKIEPKLISGRQEMLENIVNDCIF